MRFTTRSLFVVLTVVAIGALFYARMSKRRHDNTNFNRSMILIHSAACWICTEYWCDQRVPDKLDLRALSNKYLHEQETGPVLDAWGKELHVETFNNGTFVLIYTEGENRTDEQDKGDDLSCFACMIHTDPHDCTCAMNHDRKLATHFAPLFASLNPGCKPMVTAEVDVQTDIP